MALSSPYPKQTPDAGRRTPDNIDPISLEILWNRLISIVNEQATVLQNASFTTVVREAGDLSAGVFDTQGNMIAQAVTGTPGHINTMALAVRHFLKEYPWETLQDGDSLISNDPWLTSGHLNDFTVVTPIFQHGKPVALFANTCHAVDVGGRMLGADARQVFEEGIYVPILKLFRAGQPNQDLFRLIKQNVRTPELVEGDLMAQVGSNEVGGAKLLEFMDEYGFTSLAALSAAILTTSEQAMRQAITELPPGTYHHEIRMDGFDEPITVKIKVTVQGSDLFVDYAGTSPQCDRGINVPFAYCVAYTTYPLKCAVSPHVPNNEGSFRPIHISAPAGCILNCQFPAPVGGRHIIGHFLSTAVFGALARVIPDRVLADGAANIWITQFTGKEQTGKNFTYVFFSSGGMGARPDKDGISATAFPSGIQGVPAEIIENVSPLVMEQRALVPDSGGPGKHRGGLGQEMILSVRTAEPVVHSAMYDRTKFPALGFAGGKNGGLGEFFLSDGTHPHPKAQYRLLPDQKVILRLPGGGGFFSAFERDPELVRQDVLNGYVSLPAAREQYGVVLSEGLEIDWEQTQKIRRQDTSQASLKEVNNKSKQVKASRE
ncbi:MAG: hydantoinase B/oxoprolinase family protein [Deltaproteobacteria bacterium]|nr:hydantoinase B/oxoprolinase family protein [Deltaproteobacteria bacterium]